MALFITGGSGSLLWWVWLAKRSGMEYRSLQITTKSLFQCKLPWKIPYEQVKTRYLAWETRGYVLLDRKEQYKCN